MNELCLTGCTDVLSQRYDKVICEPIFRAYGFQGFVLFKCGVSFTDFKSVAEWVAKVGTQDIVLAPSFGTWAPGQATTSTIPGGCGETYSEFSETPVTFTTPSTAENYSDEDFWYAFSKGAGGYTLGYINCDGRVYLKDSTVSAYKAAPVGALAITNPGFTFSVVSKPQWIQGPNGLGKAGLWSVGLNIVQVDLHRSIEIAGLIAALKAA